MLTIGAKKLVQKGESEEEGEEEEGGGDDFVPRNEGRYIICGVLFRSFIQSLAIARRHNSQVTLSRWFMIRIMTP